MERHLNTNLSIPKHGRGGGKFPSKSGSQDRSPWDDLAMNIFLSIDLSLKLEYFTLTIFSGKSLDFLESLQKYV